MASQINNSEISHDNPAIQPLIDKILPDIQRVLRRDQNPELPRSDLKIGELANAAVYYINEVVRLMLDLTHIHLGSGGAASLTDSRSQSRPSHAMATLRRARCAERKNPRLPFERLNRDPKTYRTAAAACCRELF
jgi:hypothetical protein